MKQYFVSGIDTEIGKTVVSAILTEALAADYWKPIQSGDLDYGDTDKVRDWISNSKTHFHKEAYRLNTPASPHYSAELDGIEIDSKTILVPETKNNLIIEGAGGLFVPLTRKYLLVDLIKELNIPVVLVIKNYLGSINHSLLSIDALQRREIPIKGIVFNGAQVASSESIILEYSKLPLLFRVPKEDLINKEMVYKNAQKVDLELFR